MPVPRCLLVLTLVTGFLSPALAAGPEHGYAATVNPLATQAALTAMKSGGNAVDGALAAAVMLSVVDSHNSGIGGGIFLLIREPDGTLHAIDGRERAPAAATRGMFVRNGKADPALSAEGPLAAGVPGWLAALERAAGKFGRQPLGGHFARAAETAENGFVPDPGFAGRRAQMAAALRRHPATAAWVLAPLTDGKLRLPDLAQSFRAIAEKGPAWFYRGEFSEKTGAWMAANGGLLSAADFAAYAPEMREPLQTGYRGLTVVGFPPPSSGGVHVAQILNILETFDLKAMGPDSPAFIHTVAEAMKLAFADRAWWLGDPDFAPVPRGLLDKGYAKTLADRIDAAHATPVAGHGEPPDAGNDVFRKHTTHFSVSDSDGWWVAATATVNTTWGSLETVPGTGIVLNNEMDDFSIEPGVPNSFGLIGAEANAVAPGKRPLSSMSPTFLLRDGQPVLSVGAAGGPTIITQVVLAVVRTVDFGMKPAAALAAPRFHQQWRPDVLRIERAVPEAVRSDLESRGHRLLVVPEIGVSQAIAPGEDGLTGAADPRADGLAAGF